MLAHRPLHVRRSDAGVALDVLRQVAGVAGVLVVHVQEVGAAAHSLQPLVEPPLDLIARALDFGLGGWRGREARKLRVDQRLQLGCLVAGAGHRLDLEKRRQRVRVLARRHFLRDLQLVHELLVQAARFPAGENVACDRELGVAGLEPRWREPRKVDALELYPVGDGDALLRRQRRRDCRRSRHIGAAPERAEVFLHQSPGRRGIEIADEGQRRVVGTIVALEEIAHVGKVRRLDVQMRADDGRAVGMARRNSAWISASSATP